MLAKYNGEYYYYVCGEKIVDKRYKLAIESSVSNIITVKKDKCSSDFCVSPYCGEFYKKVDMSELTDIFDVDFFVEYDTGLPTLGVMNWFFDKAKGDMIKLEYSPGQLPGWYPEEQYVCYKYVGRDEILSSKMVTVYTKKNGVMYSEPYIVEEYLDYDQLIYLFNQYSRENL